MTDLSDTGSENYLDGQFLVAMPGMEDDNFAHAVVYLCAHSEEGAMGIVLNQPTCELTFRDLLKQLKIVAEEEILFSDAIDLMPVFRGGPVEAGRGFVLHSDDFYLESSTLEIDGGICLTATLDILKAIAAGQGPRRAMLALGYAGWAPGQLELEIQANGWLTCEAEPSIIFDRPPEERWRAAMSALGVDPAMLSTETGHA